MTSLFDHLGSYEPPLPVKSMEELITAGERGVALLEFCTVDEDSSRRWEETHDEQSISADTAAADEGTMQARVMMDAAKEEAVRETKTSMEAEFGLERAREQLRVQGLCTEFARDRQRYFAAAETQVVKLALAIARRVLAREVAADALHLAATVKAALARVQDGSETLLRVSLEEVEEWRALFSRDELRVQVVGEWRIAPGGCVLETSVGQVDLAVNTQMNEIERGFEELMHRQGE